MEVSTYYINNIPLYVRRLPSGCISIWHPYNLELADIIYDICLGKGYWNKKYKNWLVFPGFVNGVINKIKECGVHHDR